MGEGNFVELSSYKRLKHFTYFKTLEYPFIGLTCEVDITYFYNWTKAKEKPFFLSFLWCVGRAANKIREFRQRLRKGQIFEYKYCFTSHTVAMEDGTYCYCNLDSSKEFEDFVEHGQLWQNACKTSGSIDESSDEVDSLIFISSIPWVSYTSLIQPVGGKEDSNPRITWGKFFEREKSIFIPVSVLCNHALVDGMHIGMFYSCLDKIIKELINGKNL